MQAFEEALAKAVQDLPECVAGGYVDMTTGMLLAVKTVDSHPSEVLDLVSAATAELFRGSNVSAIEQLFKKSRGLKDDGHHYFQEMIVFSDNLLHLFLRCKIHRDHVVVFVARKSANIGMLLAKGRFCLPDLEAYV